MAAEDIVEKIEAIGDGKSDNKIVGKVPNADKFDQLMSQPSNSPEVALEEKTAADPLSNNNPAQPGQQATKTQSVENKVDIRVSPQEFIYQTRTAIDMVRQASPLPLDNNFIKKDFRPVMRNKLTHMEDSLDSLRAALSNAGVEYTAPETKSSHNPIERFLGNLEHAQIQIDNLGGFLAAMDAKNQELSPANMLAIQIKVNHVQQELEFFTSMLNKALESTKTIMNVQV